MNKGKRLRRSIAAAATAALMLGMSVFPAMADEGSLTNAWVLNEEGYWNYYRGNGEMAVDEERQIHGEYYAFDEEGHMYSDMLFQSPDEEDEMRYAFPDGHLASNTWVKLTGDSLYDGGDIYEWRYFEGSPGAMVKGREITLRDGTYAFDEAGVMYEQTWVAVDSDGNVIGADVDAGVRSELGYYQKDGYRAVDKKLPITYGKASSDAEYWYNFNESGIVTNIVQLATPSTADRVVENIIPVSPSDDSPAPARRVLSVDIATGSNASIEIEYVAGDELEMEFKVTLRDEDFPVNHEELTDDHEIWVHAIGRARFSITDENEGIITVTYTPSHMNGEAVSLVVDGEESPGYELVPKAASEMTAEEMSRQATSVLDMAANSELNPTAAQEQLSSIYKSADAEQKLDLQQTMLDSSSYETLANAYALQNGISESVNVSEAAQAMLDVSKASLVGGALNVTGADGIRNSVVLQVGDTDEEPVLPQTFVNQIAFDITLSVDDELVSELDIPVKIVLPVPAGYNVSSVSLYHIHDGEEPAEVELTHNSSEGTVAFMADRFSTYVFAQNEELDVEDPGTEDPGTEDPGTGDGGNTGTSTDSGSDSDSDSSSGRYEAGWVLDTIGWWYRNSDGSYPVNTWSYLMYQNRMDWYHFNANGYIDTGWFTDTDGTVYYLNPVSDGFKGAMMTGWQQIDGSWYYFHTEPDGRRGALYISTETPDGYQVNERGQRVE